MGLEHRTHPQTVRHRNKIKLKLNCINKRNENRSITVSVLRKNDTLNARIAHPRAVTKRTYKRKLSIRCNKYTPKKLPKPKLKKKNHKYF